MASNDALIGRALAGRYRLLQRRGIGAHGIVLDAVDEQLQRPVAVKIMLPQFVNSQPLEARFRLEAQVAGSLTHPNLNAVYDWGVEEVEGTPVPYLVLEHLSGGSLRDMLDRGRLLTPSQALMVGLDACRGLDYMHKRGVIHRDLKPANLAFGDDRHLRILDVGVSRMVAEQTWREPTAAGIDAARYASPEQARGGNPADGTLDSSTDIYSLCLVMIEAVTGQVPFSSDSTVATLNARLDKLMPVSADFGPLASVLSRAGNPNRADRYDAAEFGRALVMAAEKLPRPGVLPIVTSDSTGGMRRPTDPTGPVQRPEPTVVTPVVPMAAPMASVPDAPTISMVPVGDASAALASAALASAEPAAAVPVEAIPGGPAEASTPNPSTPDAAKPGPESLPATDQPRTETIDVLAAAPTIDIMLANADIDGTPHFSPPPPPTSADPVVAPTAPTAPAAAGASAAAQSPVVAEPPEPAAFPAHRHDAAPASDDFSISMATEPRPTASTPSIAARTTTPRSAPIGATAPTAAQPESTLHIAPRVLDNTGETRLYDQSEDDLSGAPPRRSRWWILVVVLLLIAAAVGAFVASKLVADTSFTVPDLVGQDESVARNAVSGNDWNIVIQKERNDAQPVGAIIRTDPAAGAKLAEGSSIVFVVSEGPTLAVLPDVTGLTVDEATATLAAVNLRIEVAEEVFCEAAPIGDELTCAEVPAGSVISWVYQQPGLVAGAEVMQDTVVSVTVSKGPAPRSVPNLKGLAEADALQALTTLGLTGTKAPDIFSAEFAAGIVADQSMPEGTPVNRGDSVVYALSMGPELVAMPTVEGQTYDQLFAAIKAAGLEVGTVAGPTDGSGPLTSVTAGGQPVVSGQMLPKGTVIDLTYTPPPETTTTVAAETTVPAG